MTDKLNPQITAKDGRQFTFSLVRSQFHVLGPIADGRPVAWLPIATHLVPVDVVKQAAALRAEIEENEERGEADSEG